MRIWHVPFWELDDRRAVAQHHEIHVITGQVVDRGHRWLRWHEGTYRRALQKVHDEAVGELTQRGFYHDSPIVLEIPNPLFQLDYPVTAAMLEADRWTLITRWKGEYKGRVPMPEAYKPLIMRYREQGGCIHNGPKGKRHGRGPMLCMLCKDAYEVNPDVWVKASELRNG